MASAPSHVQLTKATQVRLRDAGLTESWLEDVIEKDSTILGLGDVTIIDRQRRQEKILGHRTKEMAGL